jgi:hypothetical protein
MDDWLVEQTRRNRESRDAWAAFAGHREHVTALLAAESQGRTQPSLCLLGAGNCNDVDLRSLLNCFAEIHLVDLDALALGAGMERQTLSGHPAIALHGGVDLRLDLPPADLLAADVVASLCLLSQLIEGAAVPRQPEQAALDSLQAIRRRHLELLVNLLKPGGTGFLITDLVSSETAPQLRLLPDQQLPGFVADCIARRNFFSGLNPAVILDLLRHDPWFAARLHPADPVNPWKWDFGVRTYAVYAIRFGRRTQS